jgi:hypothetical protein
LIKRHSCKRCIYYGGVACAVNPFKFDKLYKRGWLGYSNDCQDFELEPDRKKRFKRRFDWEDRRFRQKVLEALPTLITLICAFLLVLAGFMSLFPDVQIKLLVLMMFLIIGSFGFLAGRILF